MKRTFTFDQLEKKVNDLVDYLNQRELKLGKDSQSLQGLTTACERMAKLEKKVNRIKTGFNDSLTTVLDRQLKNVTFSEMSLVKNDMDLRRVTNQVKTLDLKLHPNKKHVQFLQVAAPDDDQKSAVQAPASAEHTPSVAPSSAPSSAPESSAPTDPFGTVNHPAE